MVDVQPDRDLREISRSMRSYILKMGLVAKNQGVHLGGSMSLVEILAALYFGRGAIDANDPGSDDRDRVILSKGHGVPAQYAAFCELGLIDPSDLSTFKSDDTLLTGHPSLNGLKGIDFASGSLGQGLSLGVGSALGLRRKGSDSKVFVIMGDGECDEGSVWEAAMSAAQFKLDNLVAIVDENMLQYDGPTDSVVSLGNLAEKFDAFGWKAIELDGHDADALVEALDARTEGMPLAVIARTVKGKGVSFAENVTTWHHGRLTEDLYKQAMYELGYTEAEADELAAV